MKTSFGIGCSLAFGLFLTAIQPAVAAPGDLDSGFTAGLDQFVYTTVLQPDGKILVGGNFGNITNGTTTTARANVARLNPDGSLDAAFNPGTDGPVRCALVLPDGKILIGGSFTTVGGLARRALARLNADGSVDAGFNVAVAGGDIPQVLCFAYQADGQIILGGSFATINAAGRANLARVSATGALDSGFAPNPNFDVNCVAVNGDGMILIGGRFTQVGVVLRNSLARLKATGEVDPDFNPDVTGPVLALAQNSYGSLFATIYIGGRFTAVGGTAINNLAKLYGDGSLAPNFNLGVSGANLVTTVYSLALQANGNLLVGGDFLQIGGLNRNSLAQIAFGSVDAFFTTEANAAVHSLALQADGRALLGGAFTMITNGAVGSVRSHLAQLENGAPNQNLSVSLPFSVSWLRVGAEPEAAAVTFELSSNGGANWTFLGNPVYESGLWRLSGLSLPASGKIRARARVASGSGNGSSGLLEAIVSFPVPTTQEEFRLKYFGTTSPSGGAANDADPDGDGVTNIAEYAFGLDPTSSASKQLPAGQKIGNNFVVSFTQPPGITGVIYGAKGSANPNGPYVVLTDTGVAPEHVFSIPGAGNNTGYIQLIVTVP